MERKLMEQFMLKVTIPHYEKNDKGRLWDAIWRAHRDVMTGARTGKLKNYSRQTKDKGLENPAVNALYDIVIQCKNEALTSEKLIANLKSQLESDTEFGAIQKLVNMSLKYILLLNEFDNEFHIDIDEKGCECPIDSIILSKLKTKNNKTHQSWTMMKEKEYNDIQEEIKNELQKQDSTESSNLYFDFKNW